MSTDGRLDLDDLGEVIEHASSLDEVRSGADDARPTLGERFAATGVPGWLHRHRAPIAAVTAAVVAVSGFLWIRRDTRPPDDGLLHVSVVDSISQSGMDLGTGILTVNYTFVQQRAGDRIEVLGIQGPGIRATGTGRSVDNATEGSGPARFSVPVMAALDCHDPQAMSAGEEQYHFVVRRTDPYGRTVESALALPVGSQNRWGLTIGGQCLQQLASDSLTVESVRAVATQQPPSVRLELGVRSTLDHDLALDVLGYSGGTSTRPLSTTATVPAGGAARLTVDEIVADCTAPHLDGVVMSPDGQTGFEVSDRTLDVYARIVTDSPDSSSASISLRWSDAEARRVTAAFATACAGLPAYRARVAQAAPAPPAAQVAVAQATGDPSARLVRISIDVTAPVDGVTVADMVDAADLGGSVPTIVTVDPATGQRVGTDQVPATLKVVDGRTRATVDWMLTCSGAYTPPSARLQLFRDGRRWPLFVSLDDTAVAAAVLSVCPELSQAELADNGWTSLQRGSA